MDKPSISFRELLTEAVTDPGRISAAYSAFHDYSFGNVLAAMFQCRVRGIPLGPIATFPAWKERGRHVKEGEKAITLCMPITVKKDRDNPDSDERIAMFVWRNRWFVLSQTDGKDWSETRAHGEWDGDRAAVSLQVERIPFDLADGNAQGYAIGRKVAVSPLAENPVKTLVHEMAHVVLGHTGANQSEAHPGRSEAEVEVEAESVAYLVGSVIGLSGLECSRGYIQGWLGQGSISERSAQRICKVADAILKAGRPAESEVAS